MRLIKINSYWSTQTCLAKVGFANINSVQGRFYSSFGFAASLGDTFGVRGTTLDLFSLHSHNLASHKVMLDDAIASLHSQN
jgi:hypothetical protein